MTMTDSIRNIVCMCIKTRWTDGDVYAHKTGITTYTTGHADDDDNCDQIADNDIYYYYFIFFYSISSSRRPSRVHDAVLLMLCRYILTSLFFRNR